MVKAHRVHDLRNFEVVTEVRLDYTPPDTIACVHSESNRGRIPTAVVIHHPFWSKDLVYCLDCLNVTAKRCTSSSKREVIHRRVYSDGVR